jgi:hypothetical protein
MRARASEMIETTATSPLFTRTAKISGRHGLHCVAVGIEGAHKRHERWDDIAIVVVVGVSRELRLLRQLNPPRNG